MQKQNDEIMILGTRSISNSYSLAYLSRSYRSGRERFGTWVFALMVGGIRNLPQNNKPSVQHGLEEQGEVRRASITTGDSTTEADSSALSKSANWCVLQERY